MRARRRPSRRKDFAWKPWSTTRNGGCRNENPRILGLLDGLVQQFDSPKVPIDQIVQEWEEFAKTLSAGTALPRWILRDHAPAILKCIADDMEVPQAPVEEEAKSKGEQPSGPIERTAAIHVSVRIESGFDLVQIMAEYRALRSCVLRMWR